MNNELTTINSKSKGIWKSLLEVHRFRDLLYTLAWRDIKVQYAQTFLGLLWAFGNPLLTLFILTFVFGTVAKADIDGIPHGLYTAAGMCGWVYFANIFSQAGNSIIGSQAMIKKIYFPRLIIPLSKAFVALLDFGILLICFSVLSLYYSYPLSEQIKFLPLFVLMIIISGLAGGIWMSALTIRYRDFQHISPMLVRVGMFVTPIAYASAQVPEKYKLIFYMNPMAGLVEGMKWSLLGLEEFSDMIWLSIGIVLFLFLTGIMYFLKVERKMADIL